MSAGASIIEHLQQLDPVRAAIAKLANAIECVGVETLTTERAFGRVLAEALVADRDSPAVDVSAMDGYAIRLADVGTGALPVAGTIPAGSPPQTLPPGAAIRIFTGAPVPSEADCVVRREDTLEAPSEIVIQVPAGTLKYRQNIRRRGENSLAGSVILPTGTVLTPTAVAAVATFGGAEISVRRRVRVVVLNTGDELIGVGGTAEAWQVRDSNGPLLEAWLKLLPWIEFVSRSQVGDTLASVMAAITTHAPHADVILLTGGVSMGDADYVPEAIEKLGGEIAFHGLPIRPGKPVLGASLGGTALLGLPGNPVSVAVVSRVIALPLLRRLAGCATLETNTTLAMVQNPDDKSLPLYWYRLIACDDNNQVRLMPSLGSGDLVSLAQSVGFVELPPGSSGPGPWQLTFW